MKNYIFDFDGTIADSFWLIIDIAHNLTDHPKLLNKQMINKLKNHSLSYLTLELGIPKYKWPLLLHKGRKQMKQRLFEIEIIPNMDLVIKNLFDHKHKLYILSNNSTQNLKQFLSRYDLLQYFNKVYGNVGLLGKARYLDKVIKDNQLQRGEVVYVGDEIRDIVASQKVQIKIAAVTWGFNSRSALKKHHPDYLINNPLDLLKIE
ncbi:MAG: HAD hydrolase-like protein [Patescibacteria group bacterium]|jgi:HAD superfamily hydrolase (TIGR01549 family)|nr:HAD hydrolase-like protein [Patescibacteria group bacterium]